MIRIHYRSKRICPKGRRVSSRAWMAATLMLLCVCLFCPDPVQTRESPALVADHLLILVLEGCRPHYLELVPMPNLSLLRMNGTYYSSAWVGQLPSLTPAGHASISTGLFPRHTGVMGFAWIDPVSKRLVVPTSPESVKKGHLARIMDEAGAVNLVERLKGKYPDIKAAVVGGRKHHAASALGGSAADYVVFADPGNGFLVPDELKGSRHPENPLFPAAVAGQELPGEIMEDPRLRMETSRVAGEENSWTVNLSLAIFHRMRPEVLMIDLAEIEKEGRLHGIDPEVISPVMEELDRDIGRIIVAYRESGLYDRTIFVVVADQGMLPREEMIDSQILMKSLLLDLSDIRFADGVPLLAWPYLWLNHPETSEKVAKSMMGQGIPGLVAVYFKGNLSGDYAYLPSTIDKENLPEELNRAYAYLCSTLASPTGPDLILATTENTTFNTSMETGGNAGADCGEITWAAQAIPMLFCGPGVRPGNSTAPARLVDLAPTVLALMGVEAEGMDGVVLADALDAPKRENVEAQYLVSAEIEPLQGALRRSLPPDITKFRISYTTSVLVGPSSDTWP